MGGNGKKKRHRLQAKVFSPKIIRANIRQFRFVILSHHVQQRMRQRGITEADILQTLKNPTRTGLRVSHPDRKRYRKNKSQYKAIDVVFLEKGEFIDVITAYPTMSRRPRKGT
jgi:hypothetical protein